MAVDSELDGRTVRNTTPPGPAWFGVIVGLTDNRGYYIVEVLNVPDGQPTPFVFVRFDDITEYLVEP